jgi:hypothetical protein
MSAFATAQTAAESAVGGRRVEHIGVILVHGIGEQRRFEHLDGQTRYLIKALERLGEVETVSVDIVPSNAGAFHAEQDTWAAGPQPSVKIVVRHTIDGESRESRILIHEVWWADVNERYSLAKQFRFWLWALAIWSYPGKLGTTQSTVERVAPPLIPKRAGSEAYDRFRLFLLSAFFALLGLSIGWITFLAGRLFNWQMPDVLRVLTNYLSAVKLYNQRRRFGPGLWWAREEFLDAVGEPPRESVRRRMVRTLCDVACNNYDRWYVLAHSQGSVVAFNGLMATAYTWPGYLDEERWLRLQKNAMAGPSHGWVPSEGRVVQPRRPVWLNSRDIAYRHRIFSRFRGFLTYGSPLEKFVAIWPQRIAVCREPAFQKIPWINLYDPIDPVSGRLIAFTGYPAQCCPKAIDVGYCASWWLLLAHLKYLTSRNGLPDAATATVRWLLTDSPAQFFSGPLGLRPGYWFTNDKARSTVRTAIAWSTWIIATALLLTAGAFILPMLSDALSAVWTSFSKELGHVATGP